MKYIALAVVAFAAGAELGLTEAQASARKHALTPMPGRKGWYIATGPTQFKVGEQFLHDGDLPKALAEAVETPKKVSKAEAAAKAAADATALATSVQAGDTGSAAATTNDQAG